MKVTLDGVDYVLKPLTWGTDLEITNSAVKLDMSAIRGSMGKSEIDKVMQNALQIDSVVVRIKQVLNSLESWTFRGRDADGSLLVEGDVLPITEDNVRLLLPSHGNRLVAVIEEMNAPTPIEVKN